MKPLHQDKINELVESLAASIKCEAQRLYYSGGVDPERYGRNEYLLAKILVTAAARNLKDQFAPDRCNKDAEKTIKNLEAL